MNILIVDDDRALNNGIALSLQGDSILQAYSINEARNLFSSNVDLVILDINLPDGSGLDYCKELRKISSVPVLFLTANDMEIDIVMGLECGADDYITKPFSLAVLRARVNAVLRRRPKEEAVFKNERYWFDFENMLFYADNTPVELSKTEQKLLKLFVRNPGRVLTRDMLLDRVWNGEVFVDENALSVTVKRLRGKLPGIPLKTVYGIGYVWENESCGKLL